MCMMPRLPRQGWRCCVIAIRGNLWMDHGINYAVAIDGPDSAPAHAGNRRGDGGFASRRTVRDHALDKLPQRLGSPSLTFDRSRVTFVMSNIMKEIPDLLQGTLDMLILKALQLGPMF